MDLREAGRSDEMGDRGWACAADRGMALPAPPMPLMTQLDFFVDSVGIASMTGDLVALTKLPAPPIPEERNAGTLYEAVDIL